MITINMTTMNDYDYNYNEKSAQETQTLCAGCSKVEPKFFALPQTQVRLENGR